ncbi:CAP family protein [Streptosporangium sp. LJ11]|uniref:CAP family protein n=1 Tax=Streptosporangium sp. LJ11 TaxID=3436927 RepID=UPI003F79BB6E
MTGTRPALPDATTPEFQAEALAEANAYRTKHHAPPLVMDAELNAYALERALSRSEQEKLAAGHTGLRAQTGENIFWAGDAEALPGSRAVNKWYDEITAYDFAAAQFSPSAGHFTQLVWKASTKVGIARVAGQPGEYFETYIVFVFEERGNMRGAFADNVLPA